MAKLGARALCPLSANIMLVRAEASEDHPAVRRVNELAFGQPNEADLVDALREKARPYISLVCLVDREIAGHIFFSPVTIESESESFTAMGLAPMAVLPLRQNQGIGSLLVREGLKECQRIGHNAVVVLGHPEYYPRFGFVPASSKGLRCEYDVPDDVFMVAELSPGALRGRTGLVKYNSEFGKA
ncbi:MAG TPA: N-acetyltransferase [Blastocatellia bacterium]|nr:N-acetyltransferase [Blastocatellia bacterium]